mgnify:CR=1 FL=1
MGVNGIYGLSGSGLDVESMVKVGMLSKQNEYDKMQQKYTKNEWKKSEFLSLYGELQTFNSSTLSQYKMSSNMNARGASSSDSTSVSATANATAAIMTHYVNVESLASNVYLIGTEMERENDNDKLKNQLQSILFGGTLTKSSDGTISIGGTATEYNATDTAIFFSLNDGKNGLLASSDENAVTATASPDASTDSDDNEHKVIITSIATAATSTGKLSSGYNASSTVYSTFDDNGIGNVFSNNSTSTETAFTYTFNDGKTSADISFSFKDLNDTVGNFLTNLNAKFEDAGLTLKASLTTDNGSGGISITNTADITSQSKFTISASESANSKFTTANSSVNNGYFANILFFGNSSGISDSSTTFTKTFSGTNAGGTIDGQTVAFDGNITTVNNITYTAKANTTGTTITNTGDQNIKITYGDLVNGFTLNDFASKINSQNTNVRATYDSVQDRFSLYNKESGEENQINISLTSDTSKGAATNTEKLFDSFGLQQSSNGALTGSVLDFTAGEETKRSGENGSVKIDGVRYDIDSNKTTVNGVSYNFVNETDGKNVAVSVTQDTAAIVEKVKSFVSDYNALMTKLYKWYDEKPNSDYKPLTSTQKENMKEEQIEKWEEKAKAGLLYHDNTLGKIITELRSAVSEKVDGISGKYNTVFSVGVSTTGLKGQLTLDEDKLNAALAEDPDAVYNIFAKLDSGETQYLREVNGKQIWTTNNSIGTAVLKDGVEVTKKVERSSFNGVAQRLGDVFMNSMKSVKAVSGTTAGVTEDSELNNLMRELQTKMSNFQRMMKAFETQLYKKYDAMESSLALLGAQLNYVTGAFQ